MSRYWSKVVQGLTPYVPGEQPKLPNLIKLNTNESPYGPSRRVLDDPIQPATNCGRRLRSATASRRPMSLSATVPTKCWRTSFSGC